MKKNLLIASCCTGLAILAMTACSTTYDTKTLTNFVDRSSLENVPESEIATQSIDLQQMKKERHVNIAVVINVRDNTPADARVPKLENMVDEAYELAVNYVSRLKAYKVMIVPKDADEETLAKLQKPFIIKMDISFLAEIEQKYDHDETMYKTSIDWKLIDNRTIENGLSKTNEAPFVKESLTCKNVTARKTAITSLTGQRMAGSSRNNAQNAYRNTLENCLIEFRAQLANRLPFGGKIIGMRIRDGKLHMTLDSGAESGVMPRMQMLILNEDGDKIAIAQTSGGGKASESSLEVWRWLSSSSKKELSSVAENRSKARSWLKKEGNGLFAICMGMPTPSKDERTQISDFK